MAELVDRLRASPQDSSPIRAGMAEFVDRLRASTARLGGGGGDRSSLGSNASSAPSLQASSATIRLGHVQPQAPGHRTFVINDPDANLAVQFKGNSISTTKYNVLTFLPKGLFEQAGSQFVLSYDLHLVYYSHEEAFEDWKRLQNDKTINSTPVDLLQGLKWESVPWEKLQVGDIVRIPSAGRRK